MIEDIGCICLISDLPQYNAELDEVIRIYFPLPIRHEMQDDAAMYIEHYHGLNGDKLEHTANVYVNGECYSYSYAYRMQDQEDPLLEKRMEKRAAKISLYRALLKLTKVEKPYGSLTGVRPTKLMREMYDAGLDGKEELMDTFDVQEEQAEQLRQILKVQDDVAIDRQQVGIYIGIPFCVSRCSYCSFPAKVGKEQEKRLYLDALKREIAACGEMLVKENKRPYALYIGGGTPTSLSGKMLEELLDSCERYIGTGLEFTLEAGRPDTIDEEKLKRAKDHGVNRLCINPQTMVERTLPLIGRSHSVESVYQAYDLARRTGFSDINMDIIAGLPQESLEDFDLTLSELQKMAPESFTIHTLSLKRGSQLIQQKAKHTPAEVIEEMLDHAGECARKMGMHPYYLYRQKYMAGNFANVGYARPGMECRYNIGMMEEWTTVIALGVGGMSKRVEGELIKRYPNPRDVKVYLDRIDALCKGKRDFFSVDMASPGNL